MWIISELHYTFSLNNRTQVEKCHRTADRLIAVKLDQPAVTRVDDHFNIVSNIVSEEDFFWVSCHSCFTIHLDPSKDRRWFDGQLVESRIEIRHWNKTHCHSKKTFVRKKTKKKKYVNIVAGQAEARSAK